MDQLCARSRCVGLQRSGHLYVYRFHGKNTLPERHHQHITAFGCLADQTMRERRAQIEQSLRNFALPLPIRVCGRSGEPLFVYTG
jgi:hypothetical protein